MLDLRLWWWLVTVLLLNLERLRDELYKYSTFDK